MNTMIMKKFYLQPQIWCLHLNMNANLLTGSDQVGGAAGTTTLKMELQTFTSILIIKNSRDTAMDIRLKASMKPESASG